MARMPASSKKKKREEKLSGYPSSHPMVSSSSDDARVDSCPTDSFDVRRVSDVISLTDGFTMERMPQNIVVCVDSTSTCTISERQVLKIPDLAIKTPLSVQVWICEVNVDKLKGSIIPIQLLQTNDIMSGEDQTYFQDLIFQFKCRPMADRLVQFLRLVLKSHSEILGYCDTCTFVIREKKKKRPQVPQPISNNQTSYIEQPPKLTEPRTAELVPPTVKEKPTLEFLTKLLGKASLSDDASSWFGFLEELDHLENDTTSFVQTGSGVFTKRANLSENRPRTKSTYQNIDGCIPAFGPMSGNIQVTLNMKNLDIFETSDVYITIGDVLVDKNDIVMISPYQIKLIIPSLPEDQIPGFVDIAITICNHMESYSHTIFDAFEYQEDEVFETNRHKIPGLVYGKTKFGKVEECIKKATISSLPNESDVSTEEEDFFQKSEIYNSDTTKYHTSVLFDNSYVGEQPDTKRFMWQLRRSDNLDNLFGGGSPVDNGGVYCIKGSDRFVRVDTGYLLEESLEIDKRITSEKYNCTIVLQLYDLVKSMVVFRSKPLNVLCKVFKPVPHTSKNEDERVLKQLEKLKKPRRKAKVPSQTMDPSLNCLGQNKTHLACLYGSVDDLHRDFQATHMVALDLFLRNPLHLAFASGHIEAAKYCINNVSTPHEILFQRDFYYNTPFHLALKFNKTKFLKEICAFLKTVLNKDDVVAALLRTPTLTQHPIVADDNPKKRKLDTIMVREESSGSDDDRDELIVED